MSVGLAPVSSGGRVEVTPAMAKQISTSALVVDGFTANVRALNENLERMLANADAVARAARAAQTTMATSDAAAEHDRK